MLFPDVEKNESNRAGLQKIPHRIPSFPCLMSYITPRLTSALPYLQNFRPLSIKKLSQYSAIQRNFRNFSFSNSTLFKSSITFRMPVVEKEVASISDLQDGQMKEVPFGEGKVVLLSKVNGQFYATSHKCTHYGAPLAKGVISPDGQITCPWHGACFNAKTGDIEDAPALDSLQKYNVIVRDSKIFVSADTELVDLARRKPTLVKPLKPQPNSTVLILGGGASGAAAAEALREFGYDGKILVVSRENYLPVDRTKLSKTYQVGPPEKIALRNATFYKELGIEFKLDTDATHVDPKVKKVTLSNGESISYDKLILSVGAWPRALPVKGADLANVFILRTVQHSNNISDAIEKANGRPKVVIIGSSFIGMEMASATIKNADVTVIGGEKVPFQRVLGEPIGAALQKFAEQSGVQFRLPADVDHILPKDEDKASAGYVVLKSGEKLPADIVIVAIGVAPATQFLKNSSDFKLERDGSLLVDEHLQVKGWENNIWASGDIATFPNIHDKENPQIRIEHWNVAENTGRLIAAHIATGSSDKIYVKVPYFWTGQFGKSLRYCGYGFGYDDIIIQGDLDELKFAAFYVRGEQVIAVSSLQKDPVVSHAANLIRLKKMPTASELRAGKDILHISL